MDKEGHWNHRLESIKLFQIITTNATKSIGIGSFQFKVFPMNASVTTHCHTWTNRLKDNKKSSNYSGKVHQIYFLQSRRKFRMRFYDSLTSKTMNFKLIESLLKQTLFGSSANDFQLVDHGHEEFVSSAKYSFHARLCEP